MVHGECLALQPPRRTVERVLASNPVLLIGEDRSQTNVLVSRSTPAYSTRMPCRAFSFAASAKKASQESKRSGLIR